MNVPVRLNDASAEDCVTVVKHGGLAGGRRSLGPVKGHFDPA